MADELAYAFLAAPGLGSGEHFKDKGKGEGGRWSRPIYHVSTMSLIHSNNLVILDVL